jgi:pyruvate dehydrogenase E1 component
VIAYAGAMAPEAFAAAAELAGGMQDVGLLAITSADRLHKGWTGARQRRASGLNAEAQVERLLGRVPRDCRIVTVCDAHPTTLSWLGAVAGNRVAALGVTAFGQSGSIADVHAAAGIDAAAIVAAAHG